MTLWRNVRRLALIGLGVLVSASAGAAETLTITRPAPHEVIQRNGVAPEEGDADVTIAGTLPETVGNCTWSYRVLAITEKTEAPQWQVCTVMRDGRTLR